MPEAEQPVTPGVVRAAALVVAAEGVLLLVLAVAEVLSTVFGEPTDQRGALVAAVFAALGGVLLLALARALGQGKAAARSPVVVVQLLMVPIGLNLTGASGRPEWGIPLLLVAATVLALLFSPAARTALHRDIPRD